MELGVGFPLYFKGVSKELVVDWVTQAEEGPYDNITAGERIVYPNNDLVVSLSVAAAVTTRIKIITVPLYLPLHSAGLMAKQMATLDNMAGAGRLTLGIGLGPHDDDFVATETSYEDRVERFHHQIDVMQDIWSQMPPFEGLDPIGPAPATDGGPALLMAAWEPEALDSVAKGSGVLTFGFDSDPTSHLESHALAQKSWEAGGRTGPMRSVAGTFFALGPDAEAGAARYLNDHYGWLPTEHREPMIASMACKSEAAVIETVHRFRDAGIDEFFFTPTIAALEQLDRLTEALSKAA
jgi:alkanesulfonate monooxygenase SsuD/methylene tetrahydromethanopterin reductase-like flavin-dependent oxidoreductase (luciferase family)